jgi:hypothetical protein
MKYLLILLTSFTVVNHLLAAQNEDRQQKITADWNIVGQKGSLGENARYNACVRGYNLRYPMLQQNGLYVRGPIDQDKIDTIKQYYPKNYLKAPDASWSTKWRVSNSMEDAALFGYIYAGCSNQRGDHRVGPYFGWLKEKDAPSVYGMISNGEYGWNHDAGCWPQATQGPWPVCSDRFGTPV